MVVGSTDIDTSIIKAVAQWTLRVNSIRRDIHIAGSPERCEFRFVIQDKQDRLYVLECIFDADLDRKGRIIHCLDFLFRTQMPGINPYLRTKRNDWIVCCDNRYWQLAAYVEGTALNRPEYIYDKWRGKVMADFLIGLRKKSRNITRVIRLPRFSITDYIRDLITQMKVHAPGVLSEIGPAIHLIENRLMTVHDQLPTAFCHGDFHPLNIIWSPNAVNAVIDWEFLGIKPEIYDAANLIGCIGSEDPDALLGDLVVDFISNLKAAAFISDESRKVFIDFVIAMRFAWLSEWLRHQDHEMIALETVYMNLLSDNAGMLKKAWGI
jgi:homoserine kinase type II